MLKDNSNSSSSSNNKIIIIIIIIMSGTQHCLCVSATLGKQILASPLPPPHFTGFLPTFLCTLHQFFWTAKNVGKCRKSVVSEIKYFQWIFLFGGGGGWLCVGVGW
jgi:hypothetical protein